ncbi:hypothetical protein CB1_000726033 [Camelus ferus]|nr:hypothetical protein CB1_000726033 [Camelus ferus]
MGTSAEGPAWTSDEGISPYSTGGTQAQGQGRRWWTLNFAPPTLAFYPNISHCHLEMSHSSTWKPAACGLGDPELATDAPTSQQHPSEDLRSQACPPAWHREGTPSAEAPTGDLAGVMDWECTRADRYGAFSILDINHSQRLDPRYLAEGFRLAREPRQPRSAKQHGPATRDLQT